MFLLSKQKNFGMKHNIDKKLKVVRKLLCGSTGVNLLCYGKFRPDNRHCVIRASYKEHYGHCYVECNICKKMGEKRNA